MFKEVERERQCGRDLERPSPNGSAHWHGKCAHLRPRDPSTACHVSDGAVGALVACPPIETEPHAMADCKSGLQNASLLSTAFTKDGRVQESTRTQGMWGMRVRGQVQRGCAQEREVRGKGEVECGMCVHKEGMGGKEGKGEEIVVGGTGAGGEQERNQMEGGFLQR